MLGKTFVLTSSIVMLFACGSAIAGPLYIEKLSMPMKSAIGEVDSVLKDGGYKIVLQLNILHLINQKQNELKIPDFNKPRLTGVRAVVFCNPYEFSSLLNSNWPVAAGCPLNLTVFSKGDTSYVVYGLRSDYALGPASEKAAKKVDKTVINALKGIPMSQQVTHYPSFLHKAL